MTNAVNTADKSVLRWTNSHGCVFYIDIHTTQSPALAQRFPYTWGFSAVPVLNSPDQVAWFKAKCPDYIVEELS